MIKIVTERKSPTPNGAVEGSWMLAIPALVEADREREKAAEEPSEDGYYSVWTDQSGRLTLSEAQRNRFGLTPDTEFRLQENADGIILRRADPALAKVIVEPTSYCNLSCKTCIRHSWDEPLGKMTWGTYESLIASLKDVPTLRTVAFWGIGEPLLHKRIVDMVALASSLGARTEIITNALLLDQEMAKGLVLAGLDHIVVSVDGATSASQADIHGGASLDLLRKNVLGLREVSERLGRKNPEIGIEFVAMKSNLHELPNLREFARDIGARSILITGLLPYTAELADETLYGHWAGKTYADYSPWMPEVNLARMDASKDILGPVLGLLEHAGVVGQPLNRRPGATGYCRFVAEGTAVVSWKGDLSPCAALLHSHTVYVHGREKRMRRYPVGNVRIEPIGDIWAKEEYRAFRKRVLDFSFSPCTDCGACELAEKNEDDCFGNQFPVCGDCLWGKGVIQCP